MTSLRRFVSPLGLSAALLGGCAGPAIKPAVEGVSMSVLRSDRIAVSYSMARKSFGYTEVMYRVLWAEKKDANRDFSGVWNADPELTGYVVDRLRAQAFKADSVYALIDPALVTAANAALAQDCITHQVVQNPEVTFHTGDARAAKELPLASHFLTYPADPAFAALSDALQAKGVRYLVQMTSMDVTGLAPGYGMVIVAAFPDTRVIDLQRRQVIWNKIVQQSDLFQLGGDLRQLEVDNLAKTKEGLVNGTNKLDFASLWGV